MAVRSRVLAGTNFLLFAGLAVFVWARPNVPGTARPPAALDATRPIAIQPAAANDHPLPQCTHADLREAAPSTSTANLRRETVRNDPEPSRPLIIPEIPRERFTTPPPSAAFARASRHPNRQQPAVAVTLPAMFGIEPTVAQHLLSTTLLAPSATQPAASRGTAIHSVLAGSHSPVVERSLNNAVMVPPPPVKIGATSASSAAATLARPLTNSAVDLLVNASPGEGTFNVNSYLGASTWYSNSYTGTNGRVANIEGGMASLSHEALSHFDPNTQSFSGTGALTYFGSPSAIKTHATSTSFVMVGRTSPLTPSKMGIAYGISSTNFYTGTIATSTSFDVTYASQYTPYRDALITGINGNSTKVVDVVNSSWGYVGADPINYSTNDERYIDAILTTINDGSGTLGVTARGATIVISAGNWAEFGGTTIYRMASSFNDLTVGAMGPLNAGQVPYNYIASYSSRGALGIFVPTAQDGSAGTGYANARTGVDVVAPGTSLWMATSNGSYQSNSGTSFAAPAVAGMVTLMSDYARTNFNGSTLVNALDARVVKATVMNSADKPSGWSNGQTLIGPTWTTVQSLDYTYGAGRVNADQLYTQFVTGSVGGITQNATTGLVNPTGWGKGTISTTPDSTTTYNINLQLDQYTDLTSTLSWFVTRTITDLNTGATQENNFIDLDLRVWLLDGMGGAHVTKVGESGSLYNNVEHLSFLIPQTGYYQIEVRSDDPVWNLDGVTSIDYGLAWMARPSQVATSGTTTLSASGGAPNGLVAPQVGQTAALTISGASTTYSFFNSFSVGRDDLQTTGGNGTFTITGGATVYVNNRLLVSPTGTINVDAGSTLAGGLLFVNGGTVNIAGTGSMGFTTYNLRNGASLLATSGTFTPNLLTDSNGAQISSVNLTSGTVNMGGAGNITMPLVIGGSGGLAKTGNGVLTLTNTNTYTGTTTVEAGKLLVNGSIASASSVQVNNGGTLGGSGIVHGAVTIASGGSLSPGTSPGTLTVTNNVFQQTGSSFIWEIGDNVSRTPAVFTTNGSSNISPQDILAISGSGKAFTGGNFTFYIVQDTGPIVLNDLQGYSFTVVSSSGGAGNASLGTVTIDRSGSTAFTNYTGTIALIASGSSVYLQLSAAVPEPNFVLLMEAIAMFVLWFWHKNREHHHRLGQFP